MSTGSIQAFQVTGTSVISASTSAANIILASEGSTALVYNSSTSVGFIRFGTDLTVSASTNDMPIPPGSRVLLEIGSLAQTASVILASGTGKIFVSRGDGTAY